MLKLSWLVSLAVLLLCSSPSYARECRGGDRATVSGTVVELFRTDDGFQIEIEDSNAIVSDPGVTSCPVAAIDVDIVPPEECGKGAKLLAMGMLFFAKAPVRLSADKLTCSGGHAAAAEERADEPPAPEQKPPTGGLEAPPQPASAKDREWIEKGAEVFEAVLRDETRKQRYCDYQAIFDGKFALSRAEIGEMLRLRARVGKDFETYLAKYARADDKTKASDDFHRIRESKNALLVSCGRKYAWKQDKRKYWGYFRSKSRIFDVAYDTKIWQELWDLSLQDTYDGPPATYRGATEIGVKLFHKLPKNAKDSNPVVDIHGFAENYSIDEMIKKYGDREDYRKFEVIEIAGRKVLFFEKDAILGKGVDLNYYFPGPEIGIWVLATMQPRYTKKLKREVEKVVSGIRLISKKSLR